MRSRGSSHRRHWCVFLPVLAVLILGSVWAASGVLAEPAGEATSYIIRVHVHDRPNELPLLAELQLDLAGIDTKTDTADFVGTWSDYQTLVSLGFDTEIVRTYALGSAEAEDATAALSDYLDPSEVGQRLDSYAASYPTLCRKIQIATTGGGRPEWAMKISDNVDLEEDEPTVFFVGQHHAREVMTPEITMDIIDTLLTKYATDPLVKHWVDANEIWVVVSHNPDGANWVFTQYDFWRKNRRDNLDGTFGVDPNRNYPFRWGFCDGSSGSGGSDTYRGPAPGSEPETQGLMQLARDQRPAMNLSYHTYGELSLHPYGCSGVFSSENRLFRDLSSDLAALIRNDANIGYYANGTPWELLYAVDGEMNDWFYGELGSYGLTIEANSATEGFQPDYATWRDSTVSRNRPGWQLLLKRLEGSGISGHVTDACTGNPLPATMSLSEVVFTNGETPRTAEPLYGRYTWLTAPGTYHVSATQDGYEAQSWTVDAGFKIADRPIRLVPNGSYAAEYSSLAVDESMGDLDDQVDPGETVDVPITVRATGGDLTNLTAILSSSDPYVIVTRPNVTFGSVPAGGTATSLAPHAQIHVSSQAPEGAHIALRLTFQAAQPLCAPVSDFTVNVTSGAPSCPAYQENLDVNPGWTIQNNTAGGWAFGFPGGGGGTSGPSSPHTGSNVYGTNLTGNYGNNGSYILKTTAYDISSLGSVELRFWRWLNNEASYDVAYIEASTDDLNWTEVWRGWGRDTDWQFYRYDLSAIAEGKSTLYVRFRLTSDAFNTESGWYLDDVSLCGETKAPAPRFVITSYSLSDGVKSSCTDHDPYADGGEIANLSVSLRNDGNLTARGTEVFISSSNPDIGLSTVRRSIGDIEVEGTGTAIFRFKVADGVSCKEASTIVVEATANDGAYAGTAGSIELIDEASNGVTVPDATDDFEVNKGWTLGSEWQLDRPLAKGGSTVPSGAGGKDPANATSGLKVLGLDLTGIGFSPGNYENSGSGASTIATSPVYDCTNATGVDVSFRRWLCVESFTADRATLDVFDGTAWRTVWTNPVNDMSDTAWQIVSYNVSQYADGNPSFRVRFTATPNITRAFCGWNVDDLVIGNGYTPVVCDAIMCAPGCSPTTEAANVLGTRNVAGDVFTWTASTDPCRETSGGPTYRVYRTKNPVPGSDPVSLWPADTYFTDVSGRDADGSARNTTFTERDEPLPGQSFFYLVVVMGSNGLEGPVGHFGL